MWVHNSQFFTGRLDIKEGIDKEKLGHLFKEWVVELRVSYKSWKLLHS